MLKDVCQDVWTADAPIRFLGLHAQTKMTVVRLNDGTLWLHSPIRLIAELRGAIDKLGTVAQAVAPNRYHHLHVADVRKHYPTAHLLAAPGLAKKRPDIHFDGEINNDRESPDFDHLMIDGSPLLNETVFLHHASRSLICTDLIQNIGHSDHFPTRLYMRACGIYQKPGLSFTVRAVYWNRKAARASIEQILTWSFDRIIPAHGDVLTDNPKESLRHAYRWL